MSQITDQTIIRSISRKSKKSIPNPFGDIQQTSSASHILKESVISNFQHDIFSVMNKAPINQVIFYEAVGTFIFIFGCSCLNNQQQFQIYTLYAVFLFFAICLSGSMTGANINPSVTLSNFLRKQNKYKLKTIPFYFIGQLIGSIAGLILAKYLNDITFSPVMPPDSQPITIIREILNEMMGTIVMVFFILQITNPNTTFIQNQISAFLCIVIFFYLAIVLCPLTSSFAVNFTLIIGINLSSSIFQGKYDGWYWIWIYFIGQVIGVIIATAFYDKVFEPIINRSREARRQSFGFSSQFSEDEQEQNQIEEEYAQN